MLQTTATTGWLQVSADGHRPCGEGHHNAKLTDAEVERACELRAAGVPLTEIALRFGVSKGCVWKIVHGRRRGGSTVLIASEKPRRLVKTEPAVEPDPVDALLTASEIAVLVDMHEAGWAVHRLAQHFDVPADLVRSLLRAHDPHGDLPVRRVCHDPLPEVPALEDGLEPGARAMGLMVWAISACR